MIDAKEEGVLTVAKVDVDKKEGDLDRISNMDTFQPEVKKIKPSLLDFMQMNRAARRRIGKLNKIKIPGIDIDRPKK